MNIAHVTLISVENVPTNKQFVCVFYFLPGVWRTAGGVLGLDAAAVVVKSKVESGEELGENLGGG